MNTDYILHLAQYTVFLVPLVILGLLAITAIDRSAGKWNKMLRLFGLAFALTVILYGIILTYSMGLQKGERPPTIWLYWSLLSPLLFQLGSLFFAIGYAGRILEVRKNHSQSQDKAGLS